MKAACRYSRLFVFALLCLLHVSSTPAQAKEKPLPDGHFELQYINLCNEYLADANYDACLASCDTLLKYNPRASRAYALKATVYIKEHLWEDAITTAQKAVQLRPGDKAAHRMLFDAYMQTNQQQLARKEELILIQLTPENKDNGVRHKALGKKFELSGLSRFFVALFILSLSFLAYQLYKKNQTVSGIKRMWPLEVFLIPAAVTFIFYQIFYHFSGFIWSQNIHFPTQDYNPYIIRDFIFDHDGVEGYTLYLMVLGIALLSGICFKMISLVKGNVAYAIIVCGLSACTLSLLFHIGFYPPFADLADMPFLLIPVPALLTLLIWWLTTKAIKHPRHGFVILSGILAVMFFVPFGQISVYDYSYILSPALRLYYGEHIPNVYFQYDLYMSLMALALLKAGTSIYNLAWVARLGTYIFFIMLFLFSRRLFQDKKLPFLLIAFDVLFRFYANMDPVGYFQITLWRIDLWIFLLLLVYWRGIYHWSVGLFLGLLLIFHRNFGFIYLAAYIQLLIALPALEYLKLKVSANGKSNVLQILRKVLPNIGIIMVGFTASYILLGGLLPESAIAYQKIGIGMMRIATTSFYWYVAMLLGSIIILLLHQSPRISERYLINGIFLVLLTIGSSMYFFGRSHEHNIINIGGPLSLCLFLLIDLLSRSISQADLSGKMRHRLSLAITLLPIFIIFLAGFFYLGSIAWKIQYQAKYLIDKNITYNPVLKYDFTRLRRMTDNSKKIFFLDFEKDFLYYYEGGYKPMGYFNPNDAWVLKKDMAAMMQNLLDSGYYVTTTEHKYADEILALLDYNRYKSEDSISIYYKVPYQSGLTIGQPIFHRSFLDTIPPAGLVSTPIKLPSGFTLQCVFKSDSIQKRSTYPYIFSNLHTTLDDQGVALVLTDETGESAAFLYAVNGTLATTPPFSIRKNTCNYLAVAVSAKKILVYINGEKAYETNKAGNITNSDRPVIIGNGPNGDLGFDGHVYEVAVGAGALDSMQIAETAKHLSVQ